MGNSGSALQQRVQTEAGAGFAAAAIRRLRGRNWARLGPLVAGPLVTLGLAILFDLLARRGLPVEHPFAFLLLSVVWAAARGGFRPGLVSALLAVLYAVHYLAEPDAPFRYSPAHAYTLLAIALTMPGAALLVARVHEAERRARGVALMREEAVALERRLSFFAEANAVLASSLDYEMTLRELARMSVPTLADWCTIHVVSAQGSLQFVAAAHRDPARDLLVRALCEYEPRRLPFGAPEEGPEVRGVDDDLLRAEAADGEHLKLYRALAPRSYLRVPLRARDEVAGVITLAAGGESGRIYGPEDLAFAEELASRAALAVDNARLYRNAQNAEQLYRMLFEGNPQPMWIFDVDTLNFLAVNDAAIRYYGYTRDEFLSMTIMDLRPSEETLGLPPGLERVGARRGEVALTQHQRKDGSIVEMELVSHELELAGRPARLVLATDISEQARTQAALQRSEEQLRQAHRMDAVGRLASGIAHDFNNLLTTIQGFGDLLLRDLPADDPHRRDVEQIRKAADRGALLSRQLLTFGRQQSLEPQPLDLNAVVRSMEGLLQRLLGADIRVVTNLRANIGRVRMDPAQLEQILVNLVLNARDVMPAGGVLTVETADRQIGSGARSRHLRPGRYVVLAVSDTGSGVDQGSLSGLFEPFAAPSPRAGLGLPIIYGIVRQNGGALRIATEPGRGTTVKIYLPQLELEEPEPEPVPAALRGTETVLVVEDEDGVRNLLRKVLMEHGYMVLEARHGRDGLLVADGYRHPIHLLVTDVVMPEMGGRQLVEQLLPQRPETKVLYISGYTSDEIVRRGVTRADAPFIQKPFTGEEFVRKVREVLDTPLGTEPAGSDSAPGPAPGGR